MRIDAHLEQARCQQQAHAKPGDRFQPLLQGLDEDQLCFRIERLLHGGQNKKETPARLPTQVTVASRCSQNVSANAQEGGVRSLSWWRMRVG